jgi:L-alanine-DL-glutamate epimerase-like enolase superfamily enzyme
MFFPIIVMSMHAFEIVDVDIRPLKSELYDPFTISKGTTSEVDNLLIKLTLSNGISGYGEIAPCEPLTGEDLHMSRVSVLQIGTVLKGLDARNYRVLSDMMHEKAPAAPAARCGLEMALLDALGRSFEMPVYQLLGGRKARKIITDITIPMLPLKRSLQLAKFWIKEGFTTLKIKVGTDLDHEIELLKSIEEESRGTLRYILDANQGFTTEEAILFLSEVVSFGCDVQLFEQPVDRDDLDGMAHIRKTSPVPVVADESVFTLADLQHVIKKQAADVVNLKIMKSGILQTWEIAHTAHHMGLRLMIGGMVETRLAMGCSLHLAAALGTIKYFDLDTPLLMKRDPFEGGFQYEGNELILPADIGLGTNPKFY